MTVAIVTLCLTVLMGLLFLGLFVWAVKDGQLGDVEEAKYEMFREDENEDEDSHE